MENDRRPAVVAWIFGHDNEPILQGQPAAPGMGVVYRERARPRIGGPGIGACWKAINALYHAKGRTVYCVDAMDIEAIELRETHRPNFACRKVFIQWMTLPQDTETALRAWIAGLVTTFPSPVGPDCDTRQWQRRLWCGRSDYTWDEWKAFVDDAQSLSHEKLRRYITTKSEQAYADAVYTSAVCAAMMVGTDSTLRAAYNVYNIIHAYANSPEWSSVAETTLCARLGDYRVTGTQT